MSLHKSRHVSQLIPLFLLTVGMATSAASAEEWLSGIEWPEPAIIEPGPVGGPPSDAIVLFNGKDLSAWRGGEKWIIRDGIAISGGGSITSKQSFGDCQFHIEWSAPTVIEGEGQGRGNSGVYFMTQYEIQILDSYQNKTYFDGQAAAIYKQTPPLVNAMRPPGEWNVYDVIFTAPRFNKDGTVQSPAAMTAFHNGVLVLNHFELLGASFWDMPPKYTPHEDKMPLSIQYHGNPVRFRNIWLREIKPIVGQQIYKPHMKSEKPVKVTKSE